MGKPKVSIIVPVYNTEKYLKRCLNSIVNQTLKDIEILIINDCSPDQSESIIKEYEQRDKRITYIKHKKNKGLGGARNTGIEQASADYLAFVDSDDWVKNTMYEDMYKKAISEKCDIVVSGVIKIEENNPKDKKIVLRYSKDYILENEQALDIYIRDMQDKDIMAAAWNKLYKKSLFLDNEVRYPETIYHEDLVTTPQLLYFSKKVLLMPGEYYYYFGRQGSIVRSLSKKHIYSSYKMFAITKNFLIEHNLLEKYMEPFYRLYLFKHAIFYTLNSRILRYAKDKTEIKAYTEELFRLLAPEIELEKLIRILSAEEIQQFNNLIKDFSKSTPKYNAAINSHKENPIENDIQDQNNFTKFLAILIKNLFKKMFKGIKVFLFFPIYTYKIYQKIKKVEDRIKQLNNE